MDRSGRQKAASSAHTSRILSSSISLKTVPLIWLGLRATQLNTGMRNLVLIGFLIFTAKDSRGEEMTNSPTAEKHPSCPDCSFGVGISALEEEPARAKLSPWKAWKDRAALPGEERREVFIQPLSCFRPSLRRPGLNARGCKNFTKGNVLLLYDRMLSGLI